MTKEFFDADIHDPKKIEDEGRKVNDDTLEKKFLVISSAEEAIKKLKNTSKLDLQKLC